MTPTIILKMIGVFIPMYRYILDLKLRIISLKKPHEGLMTVNQADFQMENRKKNFSQSSNYCTVEARSCTGEGRIRKVSL